MKKRVVLGLSGGVDSSVAASMLLEQGYEVIGIFMRNWHDESVIINNECPWIDDSNDAMLVAESLGIPFQVMDLSEDYRKRIVDYMFVEYEAGRTPNPDILCNREIKFDLFLKAAIQLKADFLATGHYCRKDSFVNENGETIYRLLAGKDSNKDQSYFLCQLNQEQLKYALFPIGDLEKPQVREKARELGLGTAEKKDSQGLCFIGKVKLPVFLQQQLLPKIGKVILVGPEEIKVNSHNINDHSLQNIEKACKPFIFNKSMGKVIGEHQGAHFYTIGQRKGLNIGGFTEPIFVLATDTQENIIYCGMGEDHPGLYRHGLFIKSDKVHWIRPDLQIKVAESMEYLVRIRYRQTLQKAKLFSTINGLYIVFDNAQKSVASGQFAAWYNEDELLGSGEISD